MSEFSSNFGFLELCRSINIKICQLLVLATVSRAFRRIFDASTSLVYEIRPVQSRSQEKILPPLKINLKKVVESLTVGAYNPIQARREG